MTTVFDLAEQDTQLKKASVSEYAGSCPSCYGTDRFRVKLTNDRWRFMCRNCWDPQEILKTGKRAGQKRGFGDEIDYLWHFRKMPFLDARAFIGGQETTVSNTPAAAVKLYMTDEWQKATKNAMQEHVDRLWSPDDTLALDYARSRGLTDATIKQFQFGYSLARGVPRLMIPSINDGRYVCIYRRDLRSDKPVDAPRWMDAPGGTKDELYLANLLLSRSLPVVLCEDAFSALSVYQECGDLVNVVATGSANCCQSPHWLARLALAPLVFVAFDADTSGDEHSTYWLNRLKNAQRLRPLLKDINDMLMDSLNIRQWIEEAIHPPEQIVTPPSADITSVIEQEQKTPLYTWNDLNTLAEQIDRELAALRFKDLEQVLKSYKPDDVLPVWSSDRATKRILTKDAYLRDLRMKMLSGGDELHQALTEINRKLVAFGGIAS